jgi:hypothetical protein
MDLDLVGSFEFVMGKYPAIDVADISDQLRNVCSGLPRPE